MSLHSDISYVDLVISRMLVFFLYTNYDIPYLNKKQIITLFNNWFQTFCQPMTMMFQAVIVTFHYCHSAFTHLCEYIMCFRDDCGPAIVTNARGSRHPIHCFRVEASLRSFWQLQTGISQIRRRRMLMLWRKFLHNSVAGLGCLGLSCPVIPTSVPTPPVPSPVFLKGSLCNFDSAKVLSLYVDFLKDYLIIFLFSFFFFA